MIAATTDEISNGMTATTAVRCDASDDPYPRDRASDSRPVLAAHAGEPAVRFQSSRLPWGAPAPHHPEQPFHDPRTQHPAQRHYEAHTNQTSNALAVIIVNMSRPPAVRIVLQMLRQESGPSKQGSCQDLREAVRAAALLAAIRRASPRGEGSQLISGRTRIGPASLSRHPR
jgi:hypothetical protein